MRPPELSAGPPTAFTRQGEIQYTPVGTAGSSAAWDSRSVRGPAVNLTLTGEGLWGGTIQDRAVLLHARDGRITGEGVDIWVTQDGPVVHVQGLWFNRFLGIDLSPDTISASPLTGICAAEFSLAPDGLWRGFGGCGGTLDYVWMSLKGVAADPAAEMPQWFFAFLGGASGTPGLRLPRGRVRRGTGRGTGEPRRTSSTRSSGGRRRAGTPPMPCSFWDQRRAAPSATSTGGAATGRPSGTGSPGPGHVLANGQRCGGSGRYLERRPRPGGSTRRGRGGSRADAEVGAVHRRTGGGGRPGGGRGVATPAAPAPTRRARPDGGGGRAVAGARRRGAGGPNLGP